MNKNNIISRQNNLWEKLNILKEEYVELLRELLLNVDTTKLEGYTICAGVKFVSFDGEDGDITIFDGDFYTSSSLETFNIEELKDFVDHIIPRLVNK